MKRILKFLIALLVGLIIFIILVKVNGKESIEKSASLLFGFEGLAVLFLTFLASIVSVFKNRFIFKTQGHSFSLKEVAKIWLVGFSISYLTPVTVVGGEGARIFLAKEKFPELPLSQNVAAVSIDKILDATVFSFFLVLGLLIFSFFGWFPQGTMAIAAGVMVGALLLGILFFYFKTLKKESIIGFFFKLLGLRRAKSGNSEILFETEKEVFSFFSLRKKIFWQGLGFSFLRYFFLLLKCAAIIFFLKGNFEVLKILSIFGFTNLGALMPTPASLGGMEASQSLAFGILGLGIGNGIVFSMVWRATDLFFCLIGFLFLIKYGVKLIEVKILSFFEPDKK